MEKKYYLNSSNSKYVTIGITPATKLWSDDNCGFYVEVAIDGKNMKPMCLGGVDGFLNLCQSLRSFEELSFAYPAAAGNYSEIVNQLPINITKKPWNGSTCYHVETFHGGYAAIAQNTCTELLKKENLIIHGIQTMGKFVGDVETKFNKLINDCVNDFTEAMKNVAQSNDLLSIEICCNFNDLLKVCIDNTVRIRTVAATAASAQTSGESSVGSAPKRKRNATSTATATKRSRKNMPVEEIIDGEDVVANENANTDSVITESANTASVSIENNAINDHTYSDFGFVESE